MRVLISREDARDANLRRFFTGEPCLHGHISERKVSNGACLQCLTETTRRYRKKFPEKKRELNRRYAAAHREWKSTKDRESYLRHREKRLKTLIAYAAANYEKISAYKVVWNKQNKDKRRASHRNRKAIKTRNGGSHTAADIRDLMRAQSGKCAYCRDPVLRTYHVDHIVPIARGGSNGKQNLQILCPTCNMRKSKRDPLEFARSLGMLI